MVGLGGERERKKRDIIIYCCIMLQRPPHTEVFSGGPVSVG